jgi:hypothetical protein
VSTEGALNRKVTAAVATKMSVGISGSAVAAVATKMVVAKVPSYLPF